MALPSMLVSTYAPRMAPARTGQHQPLKKFPVDVAHLQMRQPEIPEVNTSAVYA